MKNRLTYFVKWARQFARQIACLGIALAVAYALALQVILASVVASGMAAAPQAGTAALCYTSTDDSGHQPWRSPAHLADCVLSCAQGFGATAILPDVAPVFAFAARDTIKGAQLAALNLPPLPSPKLAQGPPSNT
jgi:hypothetical protein